jgi:hypothetical protein
MLSFGGSVTKATFWRDVDRSGLRKIAALRSGFAAEWCPRAMSARAFVSVLPGLPISSERMTISRRSRD